MAARVAVGILFAVLNEGYLEGSKSKESDYELFSRLLLQHSVDKPQEGMAAYLNRERAAQLVKYARLGYFGHHNLILKAEKFEKREETAHSYIYVDQPTIVSNSK